MLGHLVQGGIVRRPLPPLFLRLSLVIPGGDLGRLEWNEYWPPLRPPFPPWPLSLSLLPPLP